MSGKLKILLSWGYHRSGWNRPFEDLKEDFDFHYLFKKYPDEEDKALNYSIRYWSEFSSAHQVLREIKPDRVVFMAIHSPYTIALNELCKRRGIPTFFFQHGIESTPEFYLKLAAKTPVSAQTQTTSSHSSDQQRNLWHALSFLARSASPSTFVKTLRLEWMSRRMNSHLAMQKLRFDARVADHYLVYTRFNARLHVIRDGINEGQMLETGVPEFDTYFQAEKEEQQNYYLLIDQPLSANETYAIDGFGVSPEKHAEFYQKLNDFCLSQGARLKIKLHPDNYTSERIFEHENTDYLTAVDHVPLILAAQGCFGTLSTLNIPAAYFNHLFLFTLYDLPIQQEQLQSGRILGLDFFKFLPEDIDFNRFTDDHQVLSQFVDQYLYKTDGQSLHRLKSFLQGVNQESDK